jgi:hypothetical protein
VASLRKLRRWALAWRRYEDRTYGPGPRFGCVHRGRQRAVLAVTREKWRRNPYYGYGPCFCLGCIGHGRCEHDDPDHFDDSACACDDCIYGPDDDAGHGDAWAEAWAPMPVVDVHAFADRGLL